MLEEQPQTQAQSPIPDQPQSQVLVEPQAAPQHRNGFSGKQVVGIIMGVLVLLVIGLAIGGVLGYRMGLAEGAQQALANLPAVPAPSIGQQTPQDQQTPRGFNLPFDQLPALNPGGPYLGVTFQMLTPELAAQEGITGTTGALVREVAADGPAAQAGLKAGDVVLAVNGQPLDNQDDLRARVATFKPDDEITLTVAQGTANGPTDQRDVKVKLGERPAEQSFNFEMPFELDENGVPKLPFGYDGLPVLPDVAPAIGGAYLGVGFELITPEVAARENITGTTGVLIKSVVADGPAAKAGLKAGDVISAVDGKSIDEKNNLSAVILSHKPNDEITLTVVQGTASGPTDQRDVKVTLAARPAQQQFQLPPGFKPGAPSPDSREG
jgi:membrane-associated protease RseP (regulator of RpoE activity)